MYAYSCGIDMAIFFIPPRPDSAYFLTIPTSSCVARVANIRDSRINQIQSVQYPCPWWHPSFLAILGFPTLSPSGTAGFDQLVPRALECSLDVPIRYNEAVLLVPADQHNLFVDTGIQFVEASQDATQI